MKYHYIITDSSFLGDNCTHGTVRFVNKGIVGSEGRLEICMNNIWGTVCDDWFTNIDARVVCKQYGNQIGTAMSGMYA